MLFSLEEKHSGDAVPTSDLLFVVDLSNNDLCVTDRVAGDLLFLINGSAVSFVCLLFLLFVVSLILFLLFVESLIYLYLCLFAIRSFHLIR